MNITLKFLKWFFGYNGIMYAEERRPAKKSIIHALKRLVGGAVQYGKPEQQIILASYRVLHAQLKRYQCKICKVHFWSVRKRDVCWKWSCVKQS